MTVTPKKVTGYRVLAGPSCDQIPDISGGVGVRFFNSMAINGEDIHHQEATTGETDTKASVRSKAIRIAALLRSRGLREGQVVVISSKPNLDQTVALLACWFAGVIVAPLHADYDYDDLKRSVKMLQPKCAFCGSRSSRIFSRIFMDTNIRCPIITFHDDSKQFPIFKKCYEGKEDPKFEVVSIAEPKKQTAIIILTLGTESYPKLVAVSHYNLFLRYNRLLPKFNKNEKLVSFFPLSCTMHILASCICFDSTIRLIYIQHFTERTLCKHIQDLSIEHMFIDGELAIKVAQNAPILDFDLSSLRSIYVAGMPLSTTNFARVCKTFGHVIVSTTYQTIETGMMTVVSQDVFLRNRQKVLSVGKLYPGINIRIVNLSTNEVVGPDTQGEIQVKSAAVMLGYYRDPEATNKAFVKGFYRTGDVGSYDSDGYIYIRGRISDFITREGHTFAFEDTEEVIRLNPVVSEVICIPHEGDIIACVIKKRGCDISANTLLDFVADVLPPYKLPIKIIFKEFFPKTVLGVVKKYVVKDNVAKLLDGSAGHSVAPYIRKD